MKLKRFITGVVVLAAIGCGVWAALKWLKPAEHAGEEEKVATEVAVRVVKVARATLHRYVEGWGNVEPEPPHDGRPAASARVASPVAGVLAQACCAEGQRVEKGATLFQLDARLADVQIAKARQAQEFAQRNFERQKKLMQGEGTSVKIFQETEQQLQAAHNDLANAQTQRDLLRITAPLAGTVTRVGVNPGEAVELLTVMAEVIDLDRLVVSANIPSAELPFLKLGQPVELRVEQPTGEAAATPVCTATLCFIAPQVDPKTGSVLVRGMIPARAGLRPGQFVRVRIASEEHRDRLAVPRESVVTAEDGHTVVAVVEGDKAVQKPVKIGLRDGALVEVEGEGLKEGDTVVSEGAYALPKETKVKVLPDVTSGSAATAAPAVPTTTLLQLAQTIPLPDVKGGFDLMAADVAGQRLFVCAQDNHTLEVIDLKAGQRVRSVPGFNEPKWVVYRPETGRLYVATAGDGKVTALDANTFAVIKEFQFKEKANNLRFDPATKELFVGVGKTFGALGIVDTAADAIAGEIKLASFPKQFELDGNLIYVNVPEANHIAVVDRAKKAVVATWPVTEAKENVPMGFDRAQHRLFVACDPGKFVVFDTASGKSVASLDIAAEADGVYYDAAHKLVYVSCGAGSVEVIQQSDADHYQLVGRVPTAPGAGTSLFVPEFGRLYVLVPQKDQQRAEIRVLGQ